MAQYKVVKQKVEIGGIVRNVGDELDESVFIPMKALTETEIAHNKEQGLEPKSEIESLLESGHIELIKA